MQVNNFSHEGVRAHPPIRRLGVLLALAFFALSAFLVPQAYARDMPDDMPMIWRSIWATIRIGRKSRAPSVWALSPMFMAALAL